MSLSHHDIARSKSVRHLPKLMLLALTAVALAGCGSSSHADGTEADPAGAVPAATPLYLGATVKPQGSLSAAALAAGHDLTGQSDPYLKLLGALRTPGSPSLDLSSDVDPWLGPHAGLFLSSVQQAAPLLSLVERVLTGKAQPAAPQFATGHLEGAMVLDTSDASAARSFLAGQAKRADAHAASYRGVSYEVDAAGLAFGLVGRFAVIGSQSGLRAVIGATQGEPSLASSQAYRKLDAQTPGGTLARLYVNPRIASSSSQGGATGLLGLLAGDRQASISLVPAAGKITVDVDTLDTTGSEPGLLAYDPEAAAALAQLPGESWLAIGLGKLGPHLSADVAGLRSLAGLLGAEAEAASTSLSLSLGSIIGGLVKPLAVLGAPSTSARRAFASWMGSAGIYAAGSSVLELKAGVVISSNDPSKSRAAVGALAALLRKAGDSVSKVSIPGVEAAVQAQIPGLPLALDIADGRDSSGAAKFVLGLGEEGVQDALEPSSTLSSSAASSAASTTLGESIEPSLELDFPTLLALLESVGLTESASLGEFLPYLRASSTLAGGGRSLGGEVERFKLVLGLHG